MKKKDEKNQKKVLSGTIVDYISWRGDLTFEHSRWGEVDSVIATMIAYANLGENELVFGSGKTLKLSELATSDLLTRLPQDGIGDSVTIRNQFLVDLAKSVRYRDVAVLDQVNDTDPSRNIQFSALTLDVPGVGIVVAFRGTDPTPVGWKEDFMMSYMSPVPSQTAALAYLDKVAANTSGSLYLAGHSKGGNLALYSAAHTSQDIQERFRALYSFDGPGLDDETFASEGFHRIKPLIHSVIPHGSIVGMLMNYHPIYRIVQSNARAIMQHDPFSWLLVGRYFLEEDAVSNNAQIMDKTIHEWLKSCTPTQRETFVTVIFSLLDKKGKENQQAKENDPLKNADESSTRMIISIIGRLLAIHAGVSWDANIRKPLIQASEEFRLKMKARQGNLVQSDKIQIDNHGNGFRDATGEVERMAENGSLSRKDALHLMLCAEEMLSMAGIITGEMKAAFWVEAVNRQYELHMTTKARLSSHRKKLLKVTASSMKRRKTAKSFQEKLRGVFEKAMNSASDEVCFEFSKDADGLASGQWDGYERSVLLHLADSVRIVVHGDEVHMTVRKDFA